jgi:uncharacterized iron-regulated membrane protein
MNVRFWRKWHRWIAFPAAVFLFFSAVTGFFVAGTEFFGEDEALREATRDLISPVKTNSPPDFWRSSIQSAFASADRISAGAPIDKIEVQFKGPQPTVTVFTGKPTGGEDRKLVFDARNGAIMQNEAYADKPFLYRLHSGEAFGDGGLVVAMGWALALAFISASGLWIYWTMKGKRERTGMRKVFW